ncbi:ATP-binding protein [Leptolyngbya sp. FACHB-541]|uniref:ATP-binding protein n=1 Tax=Leptolyngbya sp. FACHB-541 TaxID=2692810 RepID=UPI001688FCDD|nr:ATP-binding protein [Leptolyngbya sp. FACHB-541]MBD1997693.1 ATP-binding protein [Leptolyngbya sp. FACHB-541]
MSPELPPSGDLIKQLTEAVSTFVRWVAELIVAKNWFTLLILIAIANLFLFKPGGGIALEGIKNVFKISDLPAEYDALFWAVEAGLLVGALAIAIRTMPRASQNTPVNVPDYKAIKGLRPFTQDDAEVFAQLQRQSNLRECLNSVTSPGFRFGILHGVSGCGKTSFLQAGILPRLSKADATHRGIYVRLGGQDPVRAIASALSMTLEILLEWLQTEPDSAGFHKLLDTAFKAAEKPLILFLDQFEQFFVYYPREEQRRPFVRALKAWYANPQSLPVNLVVAVRSDLLYQLDELHKALGYALGPQEVFRLEKFTPTETVSVLRAIAHLEHLNFDARFVTELAEAELADRDDGRISPVDVQILAWMIEQQPQGELRAFDRNAFQKFGGVEGLLQRFLERTLDARMLPNQRQSALKVLLALTDLDRQVRAGVLAVNELVTKLKDTVSADEVAEAVRWLARGDVRLITPQEREGVVGYELAHERLIPALLRQTQKEMTDVERAKQLLDRRVNEWLGNQRDSRYFFNFQELWLIRKQRPYIDWSAKREQKETLIRRSQRRVYGTLAVVLLLISLAAGFGGWLRFTPSGQLQGMRWELDRQLANERDNQVAEVAVAFTKNDQCQKPLT